MSLSRIALALFSLIFALSAAAWRTYAPVDPATTLQSAPLSLNAWRNALRRDDASCWRWGDLAWALADAGQTDLARRCYNRALELGPGVPAIWMSHANFLFLHNEPHEGLKSAARVLQMVPDYDGGIFNDFDMIDDPALVLSYIGNQRRATNAWLQHLIALNRPAPAHLVWDRISAAHFADDPLAASYVDYLVRTNQLDSAGQMWSAYLGDRRGDYPAQNLLFNGDFEMPPVPSALDWRIDNVPDQFETIRDSAQSHAGKYSIRIRFNGQSNVPYNNLSQISLLPGAGTYRLSAWIKTDGITTNEGIRFAIAGLGPLAKTDMTSDSITGSHDWMRVNLEFTTPQAGAIRVSVIRQQSLKFDNKIQGTAWIDSLELTPISDGKRSPRKSEAA